MEYPTKRFDQPHFPRRPSFNARYRFRIAFALTLAMLAAPLQAEPIEPMTGKSAVNQVSAIAAKFSDVYSDDPSRVLDFMIGSSIKEALASEGIERITLICIDGFTKIYEIGKTPISKTKKITYEDAKSNLVEFEDGTSLHAKWHQCSARPISFIIYRKLKSEQPLQPTALRVVTELDVGDFAHLHLDEIQ